MVKKYAAAAAIMIVAALLVAFFPTEKRKARRLLMNTAAWASKTGDENPVVIAAKAGKAGRFFSPKVGFVYEKRELERELAIEDLQRGYLLLMRQKTRFKVMLADVEIEITGEDTASAEATVLIESEGGDSGDLSNVNEVAFELRKGDEGWRISGIRIREVLDK